jgi:hypothetical protein
MQVMFMMLLFDALMMLLLFDALSVDSGSVCFMATWKRTLFYREPRTDRSKSEAGLVDHWQFLPRVKSAELLWALGAALG